MSSVVKVARGSLLASSLGFVVVLLDVSAVNVALDALRLEFQSGVAGLQWVINAYTLVFAALLLSAGALGDRFGARAVFMFGFGVFTVSSAACGLSDSLPVLIASRLVQGLGAALLVPNSLAMLQQAFPGREARSRAVGWWGAFGGVALAAGPVLGGVLVTHLGWRSIFLMNLPVGVIGLYLTWRFGLAGHGNRGRSLDWAGQGSAMVALAALAMGLAQGWVWLLVSAVAVMVFLTIEARSASPMLPLALFRAPAFSVACAAGVIVNAAYYGLIFVFSLFFQIQQDMSPQMTGLAFLPMTVVLMAVNVLAGRLITRMGARRLMMAGLGLAALGYALLLPVSVDGSYWLLVVPMLLAASGIALMVPTMTNTVLSSVEASRAGIASAVLNSARQIGGMLGVAVFAYLLRDPSPVAFMQGMHAAIGISVGLLLSGLALVTLAI